MSAYRGRVEAMRRRVHRSGGWRAAIICVHASGCICDCVEPKDPSAEGQEGAFLTVGPGSGCASPLPTVSYHDASAELGALAGPDLTATHNVDGGAAIADLDGDGDLDLINGFTSQGVDGHSSSVRLDRYWNETGIFTASSEQTATLSLTVTDLDGDDIPELLTGDSAGGVIMHPPTRTIVDVPIGVGGLLRELAPSDVDQDGKTDLFALVGIKSRTPDDLADTLARGLGDDRWQVDTAAVPKTGIGGAGFDAQWFDADADGDDDLYVVNDMGPTFGGDVFFENVEGSLTVNHGALPVHSGMGIDVGDVDGDGLLDAYLTATDDNRLLRGVGDGTFIDVTAATGADTVELGGMGWGAVFLDFDNDGQTDVLLAQGDQWGYEDGDVWGEQRSAPINLLRQDDGTFTDVGEQLGLAREGSFRHTVVADLNADGLLDLFVTDVVEAPKLYLSDGCTAQNWVEVEAPAASTVAVTAGSRTWFDEVTTDSGYGASGPPLVHVGIGDADRIDQIEVRAPDGTVQRIAEPIAARRRVSWTR